MAGRCAICGANHATCGAGRAPVNVVDLTPASRRAPVADLAMYEVEYRAGTTRQKLSEEDAKVFGDRAKKVGGVKKLSPVEVSRPGYADDSSNVESVAPKAPEPKGDEKRTDKPADKPADEKAAEAPKNKARSAANKSV